MQLLHLWLDKKWICITEQWTPTWKSLMKNRIEVAITCVYNILQFIDVSCLLNLLCIQHSQLKSSKSLWQILHIDTSANKFRGKLVCQNENLCYFTSSNWWKATIPDLLKFTLNICDSQTVRSMDVSLMIIFFSVLCNVWWFLNYSDLLLTKCK